MGNFAFTNIAITDNVLYSTMNDLLQELEEWLNGTTASADITLTGNMTAATYGAASVTDTELGYLDGVTSAIQTQFANHLNGTTPFTAIDVNGGDIANAVVVGGVTASNLVDKSTTETIAGVWTFTGVPIISQITNTGTLTLPTSTDTLVGKATTDVLTNKSLSDSTCFIVDNADNTKKVAFQVSGITTSTTRTLTIQDSDDTLVGRATTDTLTNKTLTSPVLTSATLNTAVSGTAVLDEDNMASNSATKICTQQSIKKYVDDQVATANELSELTDVTITSATTGDLLAYTGAGWENQAQTYITKVGTIGTGVWQGTVVGKDYVPNHDSLNGFVANEHIDWTSTSSNFNTSGTAATGALTVTGAISSTTNISATGNVKGATYGNAGTVSDTELTYLSGVTSDVQTQINNLASGAAFDATVTSTSASSSLPVWILENTNDDATAATFRLYKNPATANDSDVVGNIEFMGLDDTDVDTVYGKIHVLSADVTDSEEDGTLIISNMIAGSLTAQITLATTVTLSDGATLATSAAPTSDAMIANKKYVDDQILTTDTLQEVCDNGATTTTSITAASFTDSTATLTGGSLSGITTLSMAGQANMSYGGYAAGNIGLIVGADVGDNTSRTNATRKFFTMGCYHYTNAEEPLAILSADSDNGVSTITIGGGPSGANAAEKIEFYTAADDVTSGGTKRLTIANDGSFAFAGAGSIAGNVGIGVTLESWGALQSALQIGGLGVFGASTAATAGGAAYLGTNFYNDGAWKRIINDEVGQLLINDGALTYRTAAAAAADSAITFSDKFVVQQGGNVGIGTSTPGEALEVVGDASTVAFEARRSGGSDGTIARFSDHANGTVLGVYQTGDVSVSRNLTVGGSATFAGAVSGITDLTQSSWHYFSSNTGILANTADGSDNKYLTIGGGGAVGTSRGGSITVYGNESVAKGYVDYYVGAGSAGTNGIHRFYNANGDVAVSIGSSSSATDKSATFAGAVSVAGFLKIPTGATLTIATGVITVAASHHKVDTESAAASDDLNTINGGADGAVLVLRAAASARTVVVKNGTGNINCEGDMSLDNGLDTITLRFDGDTLTWIELSRSNNGA